MSKTQAIQIHGFDGLAFRVDLDDESGAIARAVQATGGHRFRLGDPEVSDRDANGILRSLVLADVLDVEGDQIPVDLTVADLYVSGSDTLLNDWGGLQLEVEQTDTDLLGLFGTTMSHEVVVKIPRSDLYGPTEEAPSSPSAARLARAMDVVGTSGRRSNPGRASRHSVPAQIPPWSSGSITLEQAYAGRPMPDDDELLWQQMVPIDEPFPIVRIDPVAAVDAIGYWEDQRSVREATRRVKFPAVRRSYREAARRGEWVGYPIITTINGRDVLLDGHHKLSALAAEGVREAYAVRVPAWEDRQLGR